MHMHLQANNPARSHRWSAGFTLIELVMVLVIIGVIAAMAVPRFASATARQQLEAAAERVMSDLEKTSTRARAASITFSVRFRTGSNRYDMTSISGTEIVELDEAPYNVGIRSASFGSSGKYAVFNAYGMPENAGSVILTNGTDTITINLSSSGEVRR